MTRTVWPAPNTAPAPGRDDHEATLDELHEQLVATGRDLMESEQLRGDMAVKFYRLRHAVDQVLAGRMTLVELAAVREGAE